MTNTSKNLIFLDFPVVTVGPDNPYRVEVDHTAEMKCKVDSKPRTDSVRWEFSGRFIDTNFRHVIPQVSMQDAGSYYCSGDNGLGHIDKEELILDVQYGPQVRNVHMRKSATIMITFCRLWCQVQMTLILVIRYQ